MSDETRNEFGDESHAVVVRDGRPADLLPADAALDFGPAEEPHRRTHQPTVAMLWQLRWLALGVFLLIALPGVAAVWMLYEPEYRAQAVIEVSPTISLIIGPKDTRDIPYYEQFVNTQVAEILNPEVLDRVFDKPEIRATSWYRDPPQNLLGTPLSPEERLRKDIRVGRRSRTSLIDVRLKGPNRGDLRLIVNAVVDSYLQRVRDRAKQIGDDVEDAVKAERTILERDLEDFERTIKGLRAEFGYGDPEIVLSALSQQLAEREVALQALDDEITIAESQREQWMVLVGPTSQPVADASESSSLTSAPASMPGTPTYEADEEWRGLDRAVRAARHALAQARQHFGVKHERVTGAELAVEQAMEDLQTRENQLDKLYRENPSAFAAGGADAASTDGGLAQLERRIGELRTTRAVKRQTQESEWASFDEKVQQGEALKRLLADHRRTHLEYEALRDKLRAMKYDRRAPAAIARLGVAEASSEPVNSRRRFMLAAMVLFGGAVLGAGTAYVRASTMHEVWNVEDLSKTTPLPFLGPLPLMRRPDAAQRAIGAECVRMVRTALLQRLGAGRGQVVQVTSAGPGAGKTTFIVQLAESLARCGKRVLLVDADLFHPCLHTECAVPCEPGLVGVLAERASDTDAIVPHERLGFSLLPAGRLESVDDDELLANGTLAGCLQRWREEYEIVLLDSSPILPVADARILARHADGTIVVVRERHCRRDAVAETLAHLTLAGGTLLGTVFVGSERVAGYRHAYYNRYYHAKAQSQSSGGREGDSE